MLILFCLTDQNLTIMQTSMLEIKTTAVLTSEHCSVRHRPLVFKVKMRAIGVVVRGLNLRRKYLIVGGSGSLCFVSDINW